LSFIESSLVSQLLVI